MFGFRRWTLFALREDLDTPPAIWGGRWDVMNGMAEMYDGQGMI